MDEEREHPPPRLFEIAAGLGGARATSRRGLVACGALKIWHLRFGLFETSAKELERNHEYAQEGTYTHNKLS